MNDTELTAAVRESVTGIHSATPVEEIVSRGRKVRARRRMPLVTGAAAVVGGVALASTTLIPAGHPAPSAAHQPGGRSSTVRLAAWTVTKEANGQIDITFRQLKDPARLQATLRADGLPAIVSFSGQRVFPSACKGYGTQLPMMSRIFNFRPRPGSGFLTINPSALPSGAIVSIYDGADGRWPADFTRGIDRTGHLPVSPPVGQIAPLLFGLVHASPQCTG